MRPLNLRALLDLLIRIDSRGLGLKHVIRQLCKFLVILQPHSGLNQRLQRFLSVNELPIYPIKNHSNLPVIEILYVATKKDFEILKSTMLVTLNSLENYEISSISIIVPDAHIEVFEELLGISKITTRVIRESDYVSSIEVDALKKKFGKRYNWVLQQVLKISYVKESKSAGVMVVDADTALLHQRIWLDPNGRQVLCPTWENHFSYYKLLEELGVGVNPPAYTFVSHHMLFQPIIVNQILATLGWATNNELIEKITSYSYADEISPFSIDYELYAQYLYSVHPDKVFLEKWSNFEAGRKNHSESLSEYARRSILECTGKYASVSFHSYLNQSPIIVA